MEAQKDALDILKRFGDSLLNESEYEELKAKACRKRKKSKVKNTFDPENNLSNKVVNTELSTRKKKRLKQKRRQKERSSEPVHPINTSRLNASSNPSIKRTIKPLLNSKTGYELIENNETSVMDTSTPVEGPEVIIYKGPPSKKKMNSVDDKEGQANIIRSKDETKASFSMNKARHEVLKLGISGFDKVKKKESEIALAIKLGAKPPKNTHLNYKELIEKRKMDKSNSNKPLKTSSKKRFNNKKQRPVDGLVGKYKDGIHFIKKNDIARIKRQRTRK